MYWLAFAIPSSDAAEPLTDRKAEGFAESHERFRSTKRRSGRECRPKCTEPAMIAASHDARALPASRTSMTLHSTWRMAAISAKRSAIARTCPCFDE